MFPKCYPTCSRRGQNVALLGVGNYGPKLCSLTIAGVTSIESVALILPKYTVHNYDSGSKGLPLTKTERHGEGGATGGTDDLRMICLSPTDPVGGNI